MAGIIVSMLLRALALGLDLADQPKDLDLVGDQGSGTGVPNVCIAHFYTQGDPDSRDTSVSVVVNCNGKKATYHAPSNPDPDSKWTFKDDRIGSITMGFQEENHITFPWPGTPWMEQDTYTQSGGGKKSNQVFLGVLAPDTGVKFNVETKSCKGEKLNMRAGIHFDSERYEEEYAIAFPYLGKGKQCHDAKMKREFEA